MSKSTEPSRITPQEAASELKKRGIPVTDQAIYNWCRAKKLMKARKIGGRWFLDRDELMEFIGEEA